MKEYFKENFKSDFIGLISLFLLFPLSLFFAYYWRKNYRSFIVWAGRFGFWFYGLNGCKFLPCLDIIFKKNK